MSDSHDTSFNCGIDWAGDHHDIVVCDELGQRLDRFRIEHSSAGIAALLDRLSTLASGELSRVAVAIETPRGPVPEALIERGCRVFLCNPRQLDRFRDRYTMAGKKDDLFDAFLLAEVVRKDRELLRAVRFLDPTVVELRELERLALQLGRDLTAQTNRLRDQLYRVLPQLLRLSPGADDAWLWDLLELASTPERLARLRSATLERVLKQNRIRRITVEQLSTAAREPALSVAPGVVEAASRHMRTLLPVVRSLRAARAECDRRIGELLEELKGKEEQEGQYRDAAIIDSMPGVGRVILAAILAEASQAIAERDEGRLRADLGVAPVTRRSGKSIVHVRRYACNGWLRDAGYWWGMVAIVKDAGSKARYRAARARGQTHARALRCVVERLVRILMAMLREGTLYDATRAAASRATTVGIEASPAAILA